MTLVKLGDTARFINGVAFKPADWADDGLPIIRIQNLTGTGESFNRTNRRIRSELVIEPGDLLVSWSATLDAYRWTGPKGVLNQHIFKVLPKDGVNQSYLFFALKQVIAELDRKTHGSTMKHVVRGDFESTRIPLPSLSEQLRVVDLLSRAENIVRMRREAEAMTKEIIPALFLDMFGDPATNPKGWPIQSVGDVVAIQGGVQVTTKRAVMPIEVPYLRVANVHRTHLDLSEIKTIRVTQSEFSRTRLCAADLLVIEGHGNPLEIGRVGIWSGVIDPCIHQNHLIRLRCRKESVAARFLWACLNSAGGRAKLLKQGKTTSGLNTISVSNVRRVSVPIPPISTQIAFGNAVEHLEAVSSQQRRSTEQSEQIFESLLADAFGQGPGRFTETKRGRASVASEEAGAVL